MSYSPAQVCLMELRENEDELKMERNLHGKNWTDERSGEENRTKEKTSGHGEHYATLSYLVVSLALQRLHRTVILLFHQLKRGNLFGVWESSFELNISY